MSDHMLTLFRISLLAVWSFILATIRVQKPLIGR